MIQIIPAVLEGSLDAIAKRLGAIVGAAPVVQLDVVDGVLAPAHSWPHTPHGEKEFRDILSQQNGFPHWEDFDFEVDLMVKEAAKEIRQWVGAGASRIVVHATSADARNALQIIQESRDGGAFPVQVGLALESSDTVDALAPYDGLFDYVQVMGIAHIGQQGAAFDDKALALIEAIHKNHPSMPIQVDGGVRPDNISRIVRAGAKRIVAGSAVFKSGDPRANIEALRNAAAA